MTNFSYPETNELERFVKARYGVAWIWQSVFLAVIIFALLSLSALLLTVANGAFG